MCAEVVTALRAGGIDHVVLKGPGFARLLYDADEDRVYGDLDVLVPAPDVKRAGVALESLGFVPPERGAFEGEGMHAVAMRRPRDGAVVDLHHTILGVGAPPDALWAELSRDADVLRVFGVAVPVPRPAAQAFVAVAHAAQHGERTPKTRDDLRRALARLDDGAWTEAASAARRLQAQDALAAGLMLEPEGAALAERLGLAAPSGLEVKLRAASAPETAVGWARVAAARGRRAKLRLLARELVPTPAYMRVWSPTARRGRAMLLAMYLWRPFWLLKQAGPAYLALRSARRR